MVQLVHGPRISDSLIQTYDYICIKCCVFQIRLSPDGTVPKSTWITLGEQLPLEWEEQVSDSAVEEVSYDSSLAQAMSTRYEMC